MPFYLEVWEQMPHVFQAFDFLPEAEVAVERIARFMRTSELDEFPARYGRSTGR